MADTIYLNDGERVIIFDDDSFLRMVEEKLGIDCRKYVENKIVTSEKYNDEMQKSYDNGYEEGFRDGHTDGHFEGYEQGVEDGRGD